MISKSEWFNAAGWMAAARAQQQKFKGAGCQRISSVCQNTVSQTELLRERNLSGAERD